LVAWRLVGAARFSGLTRRLDSAGASNAFSNIYDIDVQYDICTAHPKTKRDPHLLMTGNALPQRWSTYEMPKLEMF